MKELKLPTTAASLLVLAAMSNGAFAQENASTKKSSASNSVEEVIITARFREESLQDVPSSVSVVDSAKIESTGTYNFDQLIRLQPSIQFISSNPRNTAVTIRGLGSVIGLTNDGIEPGVGLYIDGVFHARPGTASVDLLDIERIEVLRGPQGTLFGKNTTAGALSLTTKAPSFDPEAKVEVSIGDQGFRQIKQTLTGGLVDDLIAGRLSVGFTEKDGSVYNVTTDEYQNDIKNSVARGQLLITPSDNVKIKLSGDYSKVDPDSAATQVFVKYGPTQRSAASQFPALAAAFNYSPASTDPYDRLVDVNSTLQATQIIKGTSATVDWDLGDVTFTSISAIRNWDWTPQNDRDFTSLSIRTKSNNPSVQDQKSQEFRLISNGDNRLDWVAGLYWFDQSVETNGTEQWGSDAARWLIGNVVPSQVPANLLTDYTSNTDVFSDTTSKAIYGQLTYDITDSLHFTPGFRYTQEEKSGDFTQVVSGGLQTTDAALIARKNAIARNQSYAADFEDSASTGQINLAYDITDDHLTYITYSRGFKSGGINAAGIPTDAAGNPSLVSAVVDPEKTTSIEIGLKSQYWDGRATVNISAYRTEVEDYQANVVDSGPGALRGYLANIEKVTVKGLEVDASLAITDEFSLFSSIAYTDGQYDSFTNAPPPLEFLTGTTAAYDLSGKELPGVSKLAGSLGGEYRRDANLFGFSGESYFNFDYSYRSDWNSDSSVSTYAEIDASALLNFRLGYQTSSGVDVSLFVRNALDEEYLNFVSIQAGNSGAVYGQPGDERSYGVTVRAEF